MKNYLYNFLILYIAIRKHPKSGKLIIFLTVYHAHTHTHTHIHHKINTSSKNKLHYYIDIII